MKRYTVRAYESRKILKPPAEIIVHRLLQDAAVAYANNNKTRVTTAIVAYGTFHSGEEEMSLDDCGVEGFLGSDWETS